MSKKERDCKVILSGYAEGRYCLEEAAQRMGVCYRQAKRLWSRYKKAGDKGLVHGSRGKASGRAYPAELKMKAVQLYQEKYDGFGPTFAAEHLREAERIDVSAETLRRWLQLSGLWGPHRKRKSYRRYRERKGYFGELLQIDGSDHAWFGRDLKRDCLLNIVDDATGTTFAQLDTGETTFILLKSFECWVERYGIPDAVYVDLKNVYVSPKGLNRHGDEEHPQSSWSVFERVCGQLHVKIVKAYSAQAKGRVERKHGVFQDRFVKELKLKKINSIETANAYLEKEFLDKLNKKFSIPAKEAENRHRDPKPYGDLNQVFCWKYKRKIKNDWTVQFENVHYQIEKTKLLQVKAGEAITIHKHLDKSISLWNKEQRCVYTRLAHRSKKVVAKKSLEHYAVLQSERARKNKSKTPWSAYNPNWLSGKRHISDATAL